MEPADKRRYFQIALLIVAAGAIFPMLYLRTSFQNSLLEVFNMSVEELSRLYVILGTIFAVGYLPSGWLADRFSAKKLIALSLLMIGLIGIYYAQIPPKSHLPWIYLAFGIFAVLTFWSALVKAVKLLTKPDEQGRVFGALDGGRGIVSACFGLLAVTLFSVIVGSSETTAEKASGLTAVIYLAAFMCIMLSVLIMIFLEDKQKDYEDESEGRSVSLSELLEVVKIKEVWFVAAILFTGYTAHWTVYYLSGYYETSQGGTAVMAGFIGVAVLWMRPFSGIGSGFLGDKFGRQKILAFAMGGASLLLFLLAFLPSDTVFGVVLTMILVSAGMGYAIRALYWSLLEDCSIEPRILGMAIGLISVVGYLPEIILPLVTGPIFTAYSDGPRAYTITFIIAGLAGAAGTMITWQFGRFLAGKKEVPSV